MKYLSAIKAQLIEAGYNICKQDSYWKLLDNEQAILENTSLGDLLSKAAKQFGIE